MLRHFLFAMKYNSMLQLINLTLKLYCNLWMKSVGKYWLTDCVFIRIMQNCKCQFLREWGVYLMVSPFSGKLWVQLLYGVVL
jgi:hypothetical protein